MDAETSAMVEQLYASGKVERPLRKAIGGYLAMYFDEGEWLWCWTHYDDPPKFSADVASEDAAARIGWSLVQACWAKGWWLRKDGDSLSVFAPNLDVEDLSGPDEFMLVSHPCPIRAMVAALNGGG